MSDAGLDRELLEQAAPADSTVEPGLNLPYPVTLVRGEPGMEDEWLASVDTLAGCSAGGSTPEEALERVSGEVTEWLEAAARDGRDIPDPKSLQSHSGRLLLRMPQTLHAELSRVAERERVSLNQFITDVLAGALGWRVPARGNRIAARAVDPSVPAANGNGKIAATSEAQSPESPGQSGNFLTVALIANLVVVAVAALVAIVVFVAVWL